MKIEIKYIADVEPIQKNPKGDWLDLRVSEDVSFSAGEYKLLPLGVAIKLPTGYEALVVPRSSTYTKYGILQANSCGVIDNTYNGDNDEWKFPALAMRDTYISKNTRICQFRILKNQPEIEITAVEHLGDVSRGGFGITGEK